MTGAVKADATLTPIALLAGVFTETNDQLHVVVIDQLSDELKQHIRDYLIAVCRGAVAAEGVPSWNYDCTVKELNSRVQGKDRNGRVGMVGELLTHMLAPVLVPHLTQAPCSSIKKNAVSRRALTLPSWKRERRVSGTPKSNLANPHPMKPPRPRQLICSTLRHET